MSKQRTIVGSKIKGFRESKGLSVEEVAERSGLSAEQIRSIENDDYLPSLGPLIKVARALGVRLAGWGRGARRALDTRVDTDVDCASVRERV